MKNNNPFWQLPEWVFCYSNSVTGLVSCGYFHHIPTGRHFVLSLLAKRGNLEELFSPEFLPDIEKIITHHGGARK